MISRHCTDSYGTIGRIKKGHRNGNRHLEFISGKCVKCYKRHKQICWFALNELEVVDLTRNRNGTNTT